MIFLQFENSGYNIWSVLCCLSFHQLCLDLRPVGITGHLSILIVSLDLVRHSEMCNCPSVIKSNDVHGQTYYTAKPRPSATPLTAPHSCSRTDRLHLPILRQDLLPHPLLLLPPVHGRTDYTCPYYTKTFCHTPYCSSLLFTDGQITLAQSINHRDHSAKIMFQTNWHEGRGTREGALSLVY